MIPNKTNINKSVDSIYPIASIDIHEIYQHTTHIPDIFYIRGNLPNPKAKNVCIVGSRKPTDYGKTVTRDIVRALVPYKPNIISGLAFGIDSIAHTVALECGINAIAFPGSSLGDDYIYPREHLSLARDIINSGGCLISKYCDLDTKGHWWIPERNYFMAGLAHIVIIIEAQLKSGSLITAAHAIKLNRELCAVPGSIYEKNTRGTHELIKQGAHIVTEPRDIIEILGFDIDRTPNTTTPSLPELEDNEIKIVNLLRESNLTRVEIFDQSNLSPSACSVALSNLEIKNIVRSDYGLYRLQ